MPNKTGRRAARWFAALSPQHKGLVAAALSALVGLWLAWHQLNIWTLSPLAQVVLLGSMVAFTYVSVFHSARLKSELTQRLAVQERLTHEHAVALRIAEAADRSQDLAELAQLVYKELRPLLPAENFYLMVLDPSQPDQLLVPYQADRVWPDSPRTDRVADADRRPISMHVMRQAVPQRFSRAEMDALVQASGVDMEGYPTLPQALLAVPLRSGERVVGLVVVQDYDDPLAYDDADMELMRGISYQVARAVERTQSRQALQRSEGFLRQVIDTNPNNVFVKDAAGRYVTANRSGARLYGLTPAEIVGRTDQELAEQLGMDAAEAAQFVAVDQEVLATGQPKFVMEERVTDAQGYAHWMQTVKVPLDMGDGQPYLLGVSTDVTERHKVEQQRLLSEARFHLMAENVRDALLIWTPHGVVYMNEAAEKLYGFVQRDFVQTTILDMVAPEDWERVAAAWRALRDGVVPDSLEFWIERPDGERRYVHNRYSAVFNDVGQLAQLTVFSADITEDKLAQDAVAENEALLQSVLDTDPHCVFIKDSQARYVLANRGIAALYGLPPEGMVGKSDGELAVELGHEPGAWDHLTRDDLDVMASGETKMIAEELFPRPDGELRWFQTIKTPMTLPDGSQGMLGVATDITANKRLAAERAAMEDRFQRMAEAVDNGLVIVEGDRAVYVNERTSEIFGMPRDALLRPDMTIMELTLPEDRERVAAIMAQARRDGQFPQEVELWIQRPDGERRCIRSRYATSREAGNPATRYVTITDVTERALAQQALKEREALLDKILQTTPQGIVLRDEDGVILTCNETSANFYGLTPDQVVGKTDLAVCREHGLPTDQAETFQGEDQQVLASGHVRSFLVEDVVDVYGERRICRATKTPIDLPDGRQGVLAVVSDVTELVQAQKASASNERMLRTVLDTSPMAIVVRDEQGRILMGNAASAAFYGLTPAETVGKTDRELAEQAGLSVEQAEIFQQEDQQALAAGHTLTFVTEDIVGATGARAFSAIKTPITMPDGTRAVLGLTPDVTALMEAQRALEQNQALLQTVLDLSPASIMVKDEDGRYVIFNQADPAYRGIDVEDALGRTDLELAELYDLPREQIERFMAEDRQVLESGEPLTLPLQHVVDKDGVERYSHANKVRITLPDGRRAVMVVVTDITEVMRAQQAVKENERFLQATLQQIPNGIFIKDAEGRRVMTNQANAHMFGLTPEEMMGHTELELAEMAGLPRQQAEQFMAEDRQVLETGQTLTLPQLQLVDARGETVLVHVVKTPITLPDGRPGILGVSMDLTELLQAQASLRESESKYRTLFEASTDGILVETLDGAILDANEAALRIYGYERGQMLGMHVSALVPQDVTATLGNGMQQEASEDGSRLETWNVRQNGELFPAEISTRLIQLQDDWVVLAYVRDVSALRDTERALAETDRFLRAMADTVPYSMYQVRLADFHLMYNNRCPLAMMGYDETSLAEQGDGFWMTMAHPDDQAQVQAHWRAVMADRDGAPHEVELRLPAPDGDWRWWRFLNVVYDRDEDGTPLTVLGTATEITARKAAEEQLRLSEARYRLLSETAQDMIMVHDLDGRVQYANPAALMATGLSPQDMEGLRVTDVVAPGGLDALAQRHQARQAGDTDRYLYETELVTRQGSRRPVEVSTTPIIRDGQVDSILVIARDISERKRIEAVEETLQGIIGAVHTTEDVDELFQGIHDLLGRLLPVENFFVALHDRETDTIFTPYMVDQDKAVEAFPAKGTLTGMVIHQGRSMLVDVPTFERLVEAGKLADYSRVGQPAQVWLGVPLWLENEVIGALVTQSYDSPDAFSERDVEILELVSSQIGLAIARKQAEDELRESERRYRLLAENAGDVIWTTLLDDALTATYVSPSIEQMLGYGPDEIAAMSWQDFMTPRSYERFMAVCAEARQAPLDAPWQATLQREDIHRNGHIVHVESSISLLRDERGQAVGLLGVSRDISSRWRLQEQLRQAVKMEALGRLAGGVAHDFNNLLTVINSYAEFVMDNSDAAEDVRSDATEIHRAAERATGLTRQLLAFSRKQMLQPQVLNLNDVVGDMQKMLGRLIGEHIEMETHLATKLGNVRADPGQLGQVLINMAVNARDAMPNGGQLMIATENVTLEAVEPAMQIKLEPGAYVVLSVSDTGVGMDDETLSHIFEPFYTTKEDGTGLGLATAYGIVSQSGGDIHVYSEPGRGTTFKVYLPQVDQPEPVATPHLRDLPRGTATVLLVEDEKIVRELAVRILQQQGYTVLQANGAARAQEVFDEHMDEIDLLVTDVIMPGLDGKQLSERLIEIKPSLKVLFMSGYTGDVVVRQGVLAEGRAFLQKPFTPASLTQHVHDALR